MTVNLSIGIKTDQARQSIRELKAFMVSEMSGALGSAAGLDTAKFRENLGRAVTETFSRTYKLRIDTADLTQQVRAAVAAGGRGLGSTGAPASGPDLRVVVQQMLQGPLDELAKAAAILAGNARAGSSSSGRASASRSFSSSDSESGARTSYRKSLPDADAALAEIRQANNLAAAAREARAEMARFFADAKAKASEQFTGRGVSASAAQGLAGRYGQAKAERFLGANAGLLNVADLERYRKTMDETGAATARAREHTKAVNLAMNDLHSSARGLAGSMGALWATWGSTIPIVAAAALGASMKSVVTVGKELEYQLRFVQVLSNGTAVSFEQLASAVRGTVSSPVEAAKGLRALAQNGLEAREAIAALPSVLQLATAGEMSIADAAYGATGVMSAFNLQVSDLGRVGDVFAKAASVSNTSVSSMVEAMKQASTVADQYGLSIEETAASLAIMAKRNIEGSAAGTALRNMMNELATPTRAAKAAIEELGLQVFDKTTGKLRAYTDILQEVRDKTALLNEKSRLGFLDKIFGERGGKAANSIISDLDVFNKNLKELRDNAQGFSKSVSDALSETTEGKIKALVSEFQVSAAQAFNSAGDSVNLFLDRLRGVIGSPEFREGLANLASSVAALARVLIENGSTIVYLVTAYGSFRVAAALVSTAVGAMGVSAATATVGVAGLTVSVRALTGALSLGLAALIPLAIEWLAFRKNTDAATEAQKAFSESIARQTENLASSAARLEQSNSLLVRRNQLMAEGVTFEDAKKRAEQESEAGTAKSAVSSLAEDRSQMEGLRRQLQGLMALRDNPGRVGGGNNSISQGRIDAVKRQIEALSATVVEKSQFADAAERDLSARRVEREANELLARRKLIEDFNNDVARIRDKDKKFNTDGLSVDTDALLKGDKASFELVMKQRKGLLNSRLEDKKVPDPADAAAAKRAARDAAKEAGAEAREIIEGVRLKEQAMKQELKLAEEVNKAKYDPSVFGPVMGALLSEIEARNGIQRAIEQEAEAANELAAAKRTANLDSAGIRMVDTEIRRREASIESLKKDLEAKKEAAKWRARWQAEGRADAESKFLSDQSAQVDKQISEDNKQYLLQVIDPVAAARAEAQLQAINLYVQDIANSEEDVNAAMRRRQFLANELRQNQGVASEDELRALSETLAGADEQLAVEQEILRVRKEQAQVSAVRAGDSAAVNAERAQTAAFGMDKFWTEFRSNAQSNASMVYDIMRTTTDGMTNMFANFVMTGKLNFKDLVRTVLAEVARMMAARAIAQFVDLAFSVGAGSTGGGNTTAYWKSAGGNVMTEYGPLPLNKYARGGITNRPTLSLAGEGMKPEAIVPLPDGRTIPVTVTGAGGGGGDTHVNMTVNVSSDGNSKVSSDGSGQQAAKLGKMIEQEVTKVINREKRAGGLLYAGA